MAVGDPHGFQPEPLIVHRRHFAGDPAEIRRAVGDPALVEVRPVGNVDGGQRPLTELRDDRPHLAGEIEPRSEETLQKVVGPVETAPFEHDPVAVTGFEGIAPRIVPSGDDDAVPGGLDDEAVPVQFLEVDAVLRGKGGVADDDGGDLPRRGRPELESASESLAQHGGRLPCGVFGRGGPAVDDLESGLAVFHHDDGLFIADTEITLLPGSKTVPGARKGQNGERHEQRRTNNECLFHRKTFSTYLYGATPLTYNSTPERFFQANGKKNAYFSRLRVDKSAPP